MKNFICTVLGILLVVALMVILAIPLFALVFKYGIWVTNLMGL